MSSRSPTKMSSVRGLNILIAPMPNLWLLATAGLNEPDPEDFFGK